MVDTDPLVVRTENDRSSMISHSKSSDSTKKTSNRVTRSPHISEARAAERWKKASENLAAKPSLITHEVLCSALRHRPPLQVVKSLLVLNPSAPVCFDRKGPTALLVALQSGCSVEVVKVLLRTWPQALIHPSAEGKDEPLEFVKKHRSNERELMLLLSLPIRYWEEARQIGEDYDIATSSPTPKLACISPSSTEDLSPISVKLSPSSTSASSTSAVLSSSNNKLAEDSPVPSLFSDDSSYSSKSSNTTEESSKSEQWKIANGKKGKRPDDGDTQETYLLGATPLPRSVTWASPLACVSPSPLKEDSGILATTQWTAKLEATRKKLMQTVAMSKHNNSNQRVQTPKNELDNVKIICLAVLRGHRKLQAKVNELTDKSISSSTGTSDDWQALRDEILQTADENTHELLKAQLIALDMKSKHFRAIEEQRRQRDWQDRKKDYDERLLQLQRRVQSLEEHLFLLSPQQHCRVGSPATSPVVIDELQQKAVEVHIPSKSTTSTTTAPFACLAATICGMPTMDAPDEVPPSTILVPPQQHTFLLEADGLDANSVLSEDSCMQSQQDENNELVLLHRNKSFVSNNSGVPKPLWKQWRLLLCQI